MPDVELSDISFEYNGKTRVFEHFNLKLNAGDFTFVLGPNGSGKSTLIKLLIGANLPSSGHIRFDGNEIPNKLERSGLLGYIPQDQSLDKDMWVDDLVDFVASCHGIYGTNYQQYKQELYAAFDISDLKGKRIKQLSGGQKQMINILLGIIHRPEIVLLDEPFVGLDYNRVQRLIQTLKALNKTTICVSHNFDLAEKYADQVVFLDKGRILEHGSPKDLIKNNPYILQEIIFTSKIPQEHLGKFTSGMTFELNQNTLFLHYRNEPDLIHRAQAFLEQYSSEITAVNTTKNNLKSTIVGLHNIKITGNNRRGKKKKGKKGQKA